MFSADCVMLCCFALQLLFQQLSVLATIVKGNIQPYLKDIFTVIKVCF